MAAEVFKGVDILDSLEQIMELHTRHYKEDFDLDKVLIPKLAVSEDPESRRLLWMSRPCGTYTFLEREVYLEGTYENNVWNFYFDQTKDPILAYALTLKGMQEGKVIGNIYPLDYPIHVERVKRLTCSVGKVTVTFEDDYTAMLSYQTRRRHINALAPVHGMPKGIRYHPESEHELAVILTRERIKRSIHATPGDIKTYIDNLRKDTIRGKLKDVRMSAEPQIYPQRKKEPER